jgi:hypothetical protein
MARRSYDENDVDAARAYVGAMLSFVVFSHSLYMATMLATHEHDRSEPAASSGHHHAH